MKYIKPADFVAVREFQAKYKRIEDDITELLTTDGSAATADELNKKLKSALNAAVLYLSRVNAKYAKDELSRAFNEGKGQADEPPKRTVAEVNEILSAQGFRYAKNAFSQNTYIELQQSMQAAGQSLTHRVNGIIKRLAKTGDDSIYNVQQAIVADLQQNGVLTVEYKNGAKQPISSYAAMAARSARIESTNIGAIGRALQAGTDLVIMTEMPQCCQVCGAYQGKVYSISGKDKRFPALFKTVLSRGYALPHPNCRHEFIPYFAEIEDPADVERMIKQSQIKYDSKGNLVDVRWQKDIQAYAQWQAGNRQRNDELHEYERMREYYAAKGIDAPYSTLGAFRTARRRDELSPAFKAWRYRKADAKQYEEWKAILGAKNMPKDVDSFQEIKYNKNSEKFLLLQHYKKSAEKGDIAVLSGLDNYYQQYAKIKRQVVGKTFNGIEIKSASYHFIDRTVGSIYYTFTKDGKRIKHEGVSVENTLKILTEGTPRKVIYDKRKRVSQKFILKGVGDVTVNPLTGELVQVNKDD